MPRLPPVTRTLCIGACELSGRRDVELVDELDHGRHLVRREACATIRDDASFDVVAPVRVKPIRKHDIGNHDGAGDRALARLDARHPYRVVAVDHRFDLFGMNLEAADIDDAAAASDEMIAI